MAGRIYWPRLTLERQLMIKYVFSQAKKFFLVGIIIFLAGYMAASVSEQCHQTDIQNQTEVRK